MSNRQRRRGLRYVLAIGGRAPVRATLDYACDRLLQAFGPDAGVRRMIGRPRRYEILQAGDVAACLTVEEDE